MTDNIIDSEVKKIFQNLCWSAEQLLRLFPDRKLYVRRSIAENDCVILQQDWQGTASFSVGNYVAGRVARLRVASFFTLENGLIVKQIDYCVLVN